MLFKVRAAEFATNARSDQMEETIMNRQASSEDQAQYLRAIFDTIPQPTFIVDADMRILDFNTAAEAMLGLEPAVALHQRGGKAFHCIHAHPQGCGKAHACQDCILRGSVRQALAGTGVCRALHRAELRAAKHRRTINLLVTASLLPYTSTPRVLLILEDLSALLKLRPCPQQPVEHRKAA